MLALASSQPTGSSSGSAPLRRSAGGTVPDGVGVGEFLSVGAAGRRGDRPRRGSGSSARGLGMVTGESEPANVVGVPLGVFAGQLGATDSASLPPQADDRNHLLTCRERRTRHQR